MRHSQDEEIVGSWLEPLSLDDMLQALREAGFSGDVYRQCFADLGASLEDEAAGALHFLRHGYGEGRIFRTGLDLAGLERLRRLPLRNRFYLRNVATALVAAWMGGAVRKTEDIAKHAALIEALRAQGGMPLLILGDASSELYRRGVCRGERWICPLATSPLAGIDQLRHAPPDLRAVSRLPGPLPVLWKFGQHEVQDGYFLHRIRNNVAADDQGAFHAYAVAAVERYASFLSRAVPRSARGTHWVAGVFPPVWRATQAPPDPGLAEEFGDGLPERLARAGIDALVHRTAMHDAFNRLLESALAPLGFNLIQDFETVLTPDGLIDEHYLVPLRDSSDLDYRATGGILSTTLWHIVDSRPPSPPPAVVDQFAQLLEEIRAVQMGEADEPAVG